MASCNNRLIERKIVYEFIVNGLENTCLLSLINKYSIFVKRLIYNDNFDDSMTIKE